MVSIGHRSGKSRTFVSVLLSGGLDSSATLAFYLERGFDVGGVFFDYGQASASREASAAAAIAQHYKTRLRSVRCTQFQPGTGEVRGRNAFLLCGALMAFEHDAGIIGIGIHAGTRYQDCSEYFLQEIQRVFDVYAAGSVRIGAPFVRWSKEQIWEYCHAVGVPVKLTYSCELGRDQPCGECLSCKDVAALDAR